MDEAYAELIGIIRGDGFLSLCQKHYRVGFAGDPINDKEYFEYVRQLIRTVWKKDARIFKRQRGIYIVINSKEIFHELTNQYGLPFGEGKCERIRMPAELMEWKFARRIIRGLVDTDGSIFVADKPGSPQYPSIEITTASELLARQVRNILLAQGFRVANIWCYRSKKENTRPSYKVALNGYRNVAKWLEEIDFSNPVKKRKAEAVMNRIKRLPISRTYPCSTVALRGTRSHNRS